MASMAAIWTFGNGRPFLVLSSKVRAKRTYNSVCWGSVSDSLVCVAIRVAASIYRCAITGHRVLSDVLGSQLASGELVAKKRLRPFIGLLR